MKLKTTNQAGIDLIKSFEKLRLNSYQDASPKKIWTIGWGSTGPDIGPGMTWTAEQCEDRFRQDLLKFEKGISEAIMLQNISDNSFAALVSLVYNIGLSNFKTSTLLKLLNQGRIMESALQFPEWRNADHIPMAGLLRRRFSEAALFLNP